MAIDLSVLIVYSSDKRADEVATYYSGLFTTLDSIKKNSEVVVVLDGEHPKIKQALHALGHDIKTIQLSAQFGEATAIKAAEDYLNGEKVLLLPPYQQVKWDELSKYFLSDEKFDIVIGKRVQRVDSIINRIQTWMFNGLVGWMTNVPFSDIGCGVRLLKKSVLKELDIYGDQHRFIPILADKIGFKIKEVEVEQADAEAYSRIYGFGVYLRRILDLLSIFFLIKFTKKPLRFFGLLGATVLGLGSLLTLILVVQRLFFDVALADRPILLVGVLGIVLGVQIILIGLIGEIIIFTHAKDLKEYKIEEIVNKNE